jgi:transposase
MYNDILHRCKDVVKRKHREKLEQKQLVSPSRHCSPNRSDLVKCFLANNNLRKLEHPPYSPNLGPAEFHLFPHLKSALKGRRFCVATDIIKNRTEGLRRLSQKDFQECFQHLYSRWQKRIILKEMWLKLLYCFLFLRNKMIPGTFCRYNTY